MRRHVQVEGVRRWAGEHIIDLQAEPFKVIDTFFEEFGNCILKGCEVSGTEEGKYNIASGLVALSGADPEGNTTFKVAPFAGATEVALPAYFVLRFEVVEREYVDEKMHPVYYEYAVEIVTEKPENRTFLEIGTDGARRFLDVTGVTHKLDKDGDGKDVVVSFAEAGERENVQTGETLSVLWGKVKKWFSSLEAVAFSGRTADLEDDAEHRLTTDTEKARWNNTYTQQETDSKDAETLRKAKEYAENQVSGLGNDVYRKAETYNKGEVNTLNDGILALAKEYARQLRNDLVNGAGEAMDTLFELSNALNNDPNFATTIMTLIAGKADSWHTHTKAQITDFPTSMPASDVYAWAKAPTKPTYSYSEVGAAAAGHNHDSVYQPKGSYAAASHKHAATDVNEDSTHRFMTDAERTKLNGIEAGANNYVHPSTHSADMITDSTAKVMMTAEERSKLASIETGANKYVHPNNANTRHVTDEEKQKWNQSGKCSGSYGTNGYCDLPGGITIQWGRAYISSGNIHLSFPKYFSYVYSIVVTPEDNNNNREKHFSINNQTVSGFYICNCEGVPFYFNWIAIGRCTNVT